MKKTCWKYCLVCKYLSKRNWIRWILILIGILVIASLIIILLIVLPTTLITTFHIPFGCLNTDFTNTGQIGDTIGGITAPIIGLISIGLLYITFKEQREFNKKQVEFNKEETDFKKSQEQFNQQQVELNQKQVELNRKQLRIDNYNLFINLQTLLYEEIDAIVVAYINNKQSIGFDLFMELNKQFPISIVEFNKLVLQLEKLRHFIEKFLLINHKSDVVYINRKIFYENTEKYIDKICSYCDYLLGEKLRIDLCGNDLFDKETNVNLKKQIQTLKNKLLTLKEEYKPKPRQKNNQVSIEQSTLKSKFSTIK